ncbi:hypothetical protein GXW82_27975 [Streptacidiphilus sp. 4-A2]|nr:hypothetical protein [Streptacidiphilus sp. 4-A2]
MNPRFSSANTLRRSVREATAKSDHAARLSFKPSIDPTSDKQAEMFQISEIPAGAHRSAVHGSTQSRSHTMQLMPEALARVHMQERLQEAEHERLLRAFTLKRRAERASMRARRALASALMQ